MAVLHTHTFGDAQGAPLLAVHGITAHGGRFRRLAEEAWPERRTIAPDLRGHGGSTTAGTETLAWRDFTSEDWAAVEFDVTAAARALDARGAVGERCVLFGSSIGSSAALRWTMAHPTVPGLVLLSPGLKYRDLDTTAAARAFGGVALVARSHERGAEDAATYLERTWGDRVTMRLVDGEAHGVRMTEADAGLVDAAVALVARAYGR